MSVIGEVKHEKRIWPPTLAIDKLMQPQKCLHCCFHIFHGLLMMICQSNWGYPHHFRLVIRQGAPVLACAVPSSSASVLRTWQSVASVAGVCHTSIHGAMRRKRSVLCWTSKDRASSWASRDGSGPAPFQVPTRRPMSRSRGPSVALVKRGWKDGGGERIW